MTVLSLFDQSNKIRDEFRSYYYQAYSLDIHPGKKNNKVDIVTNILDWNYKVFSPGHFNFLFIALPCQCYSIASGATHFKKSLPITSHAINAINILIKVYQIIAYFKADYIIENPSGGLVNNKFFKAFFKVELTRITLRSFGYPTQKKTDLFHNFNLLFLSNPTVRVNGQYQAQRLDNLSYRKKVTYPDHFCSAIVESIINYYSQQNDR